jgi:23S rRNA (adenine-N6)-dimethyltransferase
MKRRHDYSQNFLRSPKLVEQLIRKIPLSKDSLVYDLGAGSGVITSVVAPKVQQVIAVEYEPDTIKTLRRNLADYTNVKIEERDIKTVQFPKTPYTIIANIPFHLSSAIVRAFSNSPTSPEAAYLVVQKQFGQKLIANEPGRFTSQLGMILGVEYSIKILRNLRKTDFWPHPAVDTVFISIIKRPVPLVKPERIAAYIRFTEECFSDPKKLARMPLHTIGAVAGVSPSRLTLDQWVLLFHSQTRY